MPIPNRRRTADEIARMGDAAYDCYVRSKVLSEDHGKFVAIDVLRGEYEIDEDDYSAIMRLRGRIPDAEMCLTRVGQDYLFKLRPRIRSKRITPSNIEDK